MFALIADGLYLPHHATLFICTCLFTVPHRLQNHNVISPVPFVFHLHLSLPAVLQNYIHDVQQSPVPPLIPSSCRLTSLFASEEPCSQRQMLPFDATVNFLDSDQIFLRALDPWRS